ncbi:MAG: hypothetical protein H7Z42_04340 [Roseiflexaceae bacterium]|nr:hypothetical protein [Roseiflexaceae bacterium]
MGPANDQARGERFANTAVAAAPDGSVWTAWIDQFSGVYARQRLTNGTLGPVRTIRADRDLNAFVDIGVLSDGTILVVYDDPSLNGAARFVYSVSRDNGASWSDIQTLSDNEAFEVAAIATGPNGSAAVAHYDYNGTGIYAAIWNGSGFVVERVAAGSKGENFLANPTAAIDSNGVVYVAWRSVSGRVQYAERKGPNNYGVATLANVVDPTGTVGIAVDAVGNLHVGWVSRDSGNRDAYYMFKPRGGDWKGPFFTPGQGTYLANAYLSTNLTDQSYAHMTFERFEGSGMDTRYLLFASPSDGISPNAAPVIEGDLPTSKEPTVTVDFKNVSGSPRDIRWKWNAPPTDANSDSATTGQGFVAYEADNSMEIPIPAALQTANCTPLTLFVQTRSATGQLDTTVEADAITFDNAVQASVGISPKTGRLSTWQQGAFGGADGHTRDHSFELAIGDRGDCSGLNTVAATSSTGAPIFNEQYLGKQIVKAVTFPLTAALGLQPATTVTVADKLGSSASFEVKPVFDPRHPNEAVQDNAGAPLLNAGGTLTVAGDNLQLLRTLTISATVLDRVYSETAGKPYWGVWVAAIRGDVPLTEAALNSDESTLQWSPIAVPNAGSGSFSVPYALTTSTGSSGLTGAEGSYYVYVKFLDGAGNASTGTLVSGKVTLAPGYTPIKSYVPVINR